MKRLDFIKSMGLLGASSVISSTEAMKKGPITYNSALNGPVCTLIPSETAGPFPLDLTENSFYFRKDIRETQTGVQLNLKLKIFGVNNCLPMPNLRVNVWHCSREGLYSGYSGNNNPGQSGLTYLRGYQFTDANGEAEFTTIFPGWYNGRICHIHFQVYVSSLYAAVSQLSFPIDTKNALYAANPSLYPDGADPMTFSTDNIFSNGYQFQLATLTPNADGTSYDAYMEVAINGSGVSGLLDYAPETGGQFKLDQNFPNPYSKTTKVPFELINGGEVMLELWDIQGKKVAEIAEQEMPAGKHEIEVNLDSLGLPSGNYAYQLQVRNKNGTFRQSKLMTAAQ